MKFSALFCLASSTAVANTYVQPTQPTYVQPTQAAYGQPAYEVPTQSAYAAPNQPAYVPQPKYAPTQGAYQPPGYVAPTQAYKEDPKEYFDQFWDNLALCDAEYDLTSCLLNCQDRHSFFDNRRVAQCTVDFVRGLCGKLDATTTGKCDNGYVKLDKDNCPTAAFADSFLVFNKLITNLNTALTVSPALDSWTYTSIKLSVKATRNNADCVINSFFNYLNQCATSKYISSHDIQCVEDHLDSGNCDFAQESIDGWHLPEMIERYGLAGANATVDKLMKHYGVSEIDQLIPELKKVLASIADEDSNGIHYVNTKYDQHTQRTSVNVCPLNSSPMNANYNATGLEGILQRDVAFHFPTSDNSTHDGEVRDLDPITDKSIYDTCVDYFETTKEVYNATMNSTHLGNRCFSVSKYGIHFIESGITKDLDYKTFDATAGEGDQCYTASWDEAKSCSSHLTEWQMTVACCKSYATVVEENKPKVAKNTYHRYLLKDDAYAPTQAAYAPTQGYPAYPPTQAAYAPTQGYPAYPPTQAAYAPTQGYPAYPPTQAYAPYYPTENVQHIDRKSLSFDYVVKSRADAGSLSSPNSVAVPNTIPTRVFAALDATIKALDEQCDSIDLENIKVYKPYGFGAWIKKHCAKIGSIADGLDLLENGAPVHAYYAPTTSAPEYRVQRHPYYVGESYASTMICETLEIELDFSEIVPLVSGQCFPQACILSQLASCMEVPEKVYDNYGYDYVAKTYATQKDYGYATQTQYQPAQQGYGAAPAAYKPAAPVAYPQAAPAYTPYNQNTGYGRSVLAAQSSSSNALVFASVGFAAGMVVVAAIQAVISRRQQRSGDFRNLV